MTKEQLSAVRAYRDAVCRFLTSASNPGGRDWAFKNEPGRPYHEMVLAQYEVDALLAAHHEAREELSVAALRMELAECRALLVDAIADPSQEDLKRAADWLANWGGKRIDVGAESERLVHEPSVSPAEAFARLREAGGDALDGMDARNPEPPAPQCSCPPTWVLPSITCPVHGKSVL